MGIPGSRAREAARTHCKNVEHKLVIETQESDCVYARPTFWLLRVDPGATWIALNAGCLILSKLSNLKPCYRCTLCVIVQCQTSDGLSETFQITMVYHFCNFSIPIPSPVQMRCEPIS